MPLKPYTDPPTTLSEQIDKLEHRGMIVSKPAASRAFLSRVNYYRFCGYALYFEEFKDGQRTHKYKLGTDFMHVINIIQFDTRLRMLLLNFIEFIEISFRTAVCYELANYTGNPHWYLNEKYFAPRYRGDWHRKHFLPACKTAFKLSKEKFIEHYKKTYSSPQLPPCWMLIEIISFSQASKMYINLLNQKHRISVCDRMQIDEYYLGSWIHAAVVLRNICAHHGRLWNREFAINPRFPKKLRPELAGKRNLLVTQLKLIECLLPPFKLVEAYKESLIDLLDAYPHVPREPMGL